MGTAVYPNITKHPNERIKNVYLVLLLFHEVSLILSENSFTGKTISAEQATAIAEKNQTVNVTFEKYIVCQ